MPEHYTDINAKTIDSWVSGGWEWGRPISHETYEKAKNGSWGVLLTPQIPVPKEWFAPYLQNNRLDGVRLLGLASGGGQQMPVFAALGAVGTVLDYSDSQLNSEKMVAEREQYAIDIVKADMTKPFPFEDGTFDLIFHPVSNCYVEDVYHVWNECSRVLKPGGVLLAGMDNGLNFLFDEEEGATVLTAKNRLPYNPLKNPALMEEALRQDAGVQFSHSLEEQLGGQLQAGFTLTHLREDRDGEMLLSSYAPQYLMTRAVKNG